MIDKIISRETPYWLQFLYAGQMFTASHLYSAVAAGGTVYVESIIGSELIHLLARNVTVDGGGPVTLSLYEAPTITDGTLQFTKMNCDRRSAKTGTFILYYNPTAVSGGTLLFTDYIATGGGPKGTGGTTVGINEVVFKPNTKYVLAITNTGTQTSNVQINYLWYESSN